MDIQKIVGKELSQSYAQLQAKVEAVAVRPAVPKVRLLPGRGRTHVHNICTSIRVKERAEFNWNSFIKPSSIVVKEPIEVVCRLGNSTIEPYNLPSQCQGLTHYHIAYTCPEIGDRIFLAGEEKTMWFLSQDLSRVEGTMSHNYFNVLNFTFISGYEIYITNEAEIAVTGPDGLKPVFLPGTFAKYYYHQRYNMGRNLLTDKTDLFILCKEPDNNRNIVYCYQKAVFANIKAIASAKPRKVPCTDYAENFCLNSKYIFSVTPNGGLSRVDKKNFSLVTCTRLWTYYKGERDMCRYSGKPNEHKEAFTTITCNETVFVVASDNQTEDKCKLYVHFTKSMALIDSIELPRTKTSPAYDPIHMLLLITIKDLLLCVGLQKMLTLQVLVLHRYKFIKITEMKVNQHTTAMWGLQFNKNTRDLLIYGNGRELKMVSIRLQSELAKEENKMVEQPVEQPAQEFNEYAPPKRNLSKDNHNWIKEKHPDVPYFRSFVNAMDKFAANKMKKNLRK